MSPSVDGVTVSIVAFQAAVPGSTPGQRNFFVVLVSKKLLTTFGYIH